MLEKIAGLLILCLLFFPGNVFPYQFRDYKWGERQKTIKEKLLKAGKEVTERQNTLSYKDAIFGRDCRVELFFTLGQHALCCVNLVWDNTDIGAKLKEELTKKYGEPAKHNIYTQEYTWIDSSGDDYDNLNLDFNCLDTRLEYHGGDYFKQYQRELTSLFLAKNGYGPNKPARRPYVIMELDGGRG
jgi:hypothetical protein